MPGARSVAGGVWVAVGGRDEPADEAGASHFLEHLLFKGSGTRSARDIAESVEALGGEVNAYTAHEHTAYYVRLPDRALGFGLDLLCDVVTDPALRAGDVDAEREVILEELLAAEDNPEDVAHRLLYGALFPDHPLGRDVLGSHDTITAMTRDQVAGFYDRWYRSTNVVVAVAGNLDHGHVVDAIGSAFSARGGGDEPARIPPQGAPVPRAEAKRPVEQVNLALGWRGLAHDDDDRYALAVLNQVLGGGMSSRLFQEVREARGLVYTIYSFTSQYADAGVLGVFAGTSPDKADEVRSVIDEQVAAVEAGGVTAHERDIAVGFLEGSLLLSLEDSASRMARLGRTEVSRRELIGIDEHIARIRAVTVDDVERVVQRVLTSEQVTVTVGP
jgi:predicted Zn-dependent peptidase